MALQVSGDFRFKGVRWRSGHLYQFRYTNFIEDPEPLVILLYRFKGTHPSTGRQWRFIQALNMNYVPRPVRRRFALDWKGALERNNGNVFLTWNDVKLKYPALVRSDCIRRYFYSPNYYIQKPQYIPIERMEEALISTWHKDFSKKLKRALIRKKRVATGKARKRKDGVSSVLKNIFGRKK